LLWSHYRSLPQNPFLLGLSFIEDFSQYGVAFKCWISMHQSSGNRAISWSLKADNGHRSPSVLSFLGDTADESLETYTESISMGCTQARRQTI
jgi:hypothetical protein